MFYQHYYLAYNLLSMDFVHDLLIFSRFSLPQ